MFHKAIVQSGGIYCAWGYTGHHRDHMVQFKEWLKGEKESRDFLVKEMEILPLELLERMYKQIDAITCASSVRFHIKLPTD